MGQHNKQGHLQRILTLLQAEGLVYRQEIAERLKLSLPTIDRYIKALRDSGHQIKTDPQTKAYSLAEEQFLPPLDLTEEESLALVVSSLMVAEQAGPLSGPLLKAVEKIRSGFSQELREGLAEVMPRVCIQPAANEGTAADDVWSIVATAIESKRALWVSYESVRHSKTNDGGLDDHDGTGNVAGSDGRDGGELFRFDPYALFFSHRAWYVVGKHHGRLNDVKTPLRTLRLSRFVKLKESEQPFGIPDSFSMQIYLGDRWRMVREPDEALYEVVLRFKKPYAFTVEETHWHKSQQSEWIGDELQVCFKVQGLSEIAYWILGYGPGVRVMGPSKLAQIVQGLYERALAQYALEPVLEGSAGRAMD